MNSKLKLTYLLRILVIVSFQLYISCQSDDVLEVESSSESTTEITLQNTVEGIVRVKLGSESISSLSVGLKSGELSTNVSNIDSVLKSIGATSFKRTFRKSGKYEARSIEKGLHLWYDITYDTVQVSLSNVISKFKNISEVDVTEPIKTIRNEKVRYKEFGPLPISSGLKSATTSLGGYPFNDEFLSYQWHYYNNGSVTDAVEGSDINLFNAWYKQKGNAEVIVAVVDGGIDVDHEDLEDNIWVNTSEVSGSSNSDDDNNGYSDDINGYNFVSDKGAISAGDHGTHVAGTIAAMNDNGIGVCGIAGGDSETPGVRLLSCQVFETDDNGNETSAQSFAEAIVYAADNGAVICQNSWGYDGATYLPESMKDAIDYFIDYAGLDENGNQVGPMAGGIVIFAAGNDAITSNAYPAMYNKVVAVGATNPDYTVSYYSNYGSWVDIMAPGGTDSQNGKYDTDCYVASTIANNDYAYMAGTSMACPHVSGVAALIISEFGGDGYSPDDVKERLYQGATDIESYNEGYANMIGEGLINAAGALSSYDSSPSEAVTDLTATPNSNDITLQWTVTSDDDDFKPIGYKVYYSTSSNISELLNSDSESIFSTNAFVGLTDVGETMSVTLSDLEYSTTYYISVVGYDALSSLGAYSNTVSSTTDENHSPIISSSEGNTFELKAHETRTITITVSDQDDDSFTNSFSDESGIATAEISTSTVVITINALNGSAGDYNSTVSVQDEYGAKSEYTINYTILENTAPVVSNTIDNVYIGSVSSTSSIDLSDYFYDADGETLSYALTYSSDYLSASVTDGVLKITPNSLGLSTFTIVASDAKEEYATISFLVMVRDNSQNVEVYPNPFTDKINIRMGEDVDGDLRVQVYNNSGVLQKQINTSISTFNPTSIDLSDLTSGQYILKMIYNDVELTKNVVKL